MRAVLFFVLLLAVSAAQAQTVFSSLEACLQYARGHNRDIAIASRQVAIQENNLQRAWYNLLPQVTAYSTLDYNFELQTQLIPAEVLGGPKGELIPVQFGTRYNLTGMLEARLPVVSLPRWKDVKVARLQEQQSRMELQWQQEQTDRQLTVAYYQALLARKSWQIAKEQQALADSLADIVQQRAAEGLAGPVEYQRSRQLALDAAVTLQQQHAVWQQRLNDLRELLHIPPTDSVAIQDSLSLQALPIAPKAFDADQTTAAKAGRLEQAVSKALWEQDRHRYLPELSVYARYGRMAQRNDLRFGDGGWFGLGVVGLRLDIPIFQPSLQRSAVRQSRLQYEVSQLRTEQTTLKEAIQWNNWREQYSQCLRSIPDARESAALALDSYYKTLLQFETGIIGIDQPLECYKDVLQAQWKSQELLIQLYQNYVLLKSYSPGI